MADRNVKLVLAYDGTAYAGWQRQKNAGTIQGMLEDAIAKMTGQPVILHGAGRTDAGVHALAMTANFHSPAVIPVAGFWRGLNSMLPEDIRVMRAEEAEADFHARYSATGKAYVYSISEEEVLPPTERLYTVQVPAGLDIENMRACLRVLRGEHDFSSFEAAGSRDPTVENGKGAVRRIDTAELIQHKQNTKKYQFFLAGNGFLRHMVRNIVGTLIEVGQGKRSADAFQALLAAKNRTLAGPTAPARGLMLQEVFYEENRPFILCEFSARQPRKGNMDSPLIALAERVRQIKPSPTLAVNAKAKAMKAAGADILNFSVGEPDFDTPDHVKEAGKAAIDAGFTKYTAVPGILELREAIVQRFAEDRGWRYEPEQIQVCCGGKHGLYNMAQALFGPGDEVLVPTPYWVSYPPIIRLAGATPVEVPLREEDGFDLKADILARHVTGKTRGIILNSPSNPIGSVYSAAALEAVGKMALDRGWVVITDDIYDTIVYGEEKPPHILEVDDRLKEQTLVLNGVSKSFSMTGWRIGYTAGPKHIIAAMNKIQSQSTSNPSSVAQKAALAAVSGPQDFPRKMRDAFVPRLDFIMRELRSIPDMTCVFPKGAFYVFPNFSAYYGRSFNGKRISGSVEMADYLLDEAKLATVPGAAFGDDRFIRFSFATSMETLQEGMKRLRAALGGLG